MNANEKNLAEDIKRFALACGADLVGIAPVFTDEAGEEHLKKFVEEGRNGEMDYLNDYEKRVRPDLLLPGAKSVVVVAVNYYRKVEDPDSGAVTGRVARYAYGRDYHKVIHGVLKKTGEFLKTLKPDSNYRVCVDSAPLLEKSYAVTAGLGFIGKNTTLITKEFGSFVVIGELLTDLEMAYDKPSVGTCGTCTRCLDACPVQALIAAGKMDARRCISYLTIEHRGEIDPELAEKFGNRIFGCDSCQEVCPYNLAHAKPAKNVDFNRAIAGSWLDPGEILQIKDEQAYQARFAGSPLMRAKRAGLQRNARIVMDNAISPEATEH